MESDKEVQMISILQAARYIVFLSYHQQRYSLTPLKLQKILYLAQGWSFVWDRKPLFIEEFEAWQYGPVNVEVYNYFRKYGRQEIPEEEGCSNVQDVDAKTTLEAVWRDYSGYCAADLVSLSHSQEPWKQASYSHETIKTDTIMEYFQSTYN